MTTIKLDLTVDANLSDAQAEAMKEKLKAGVEGIIDDLNLNALNMKSPQIDEYSMDAVINPDNYLDLIGNYLSERVENGDMPIEDLPRQMAANGLCTVTDFIDFFRPLIADIK
jgi:hypothetical protein